MFKINLFKIITSEELRQSFLTVRFDCFMLTTHVLIMYNCTLNKSWFLTTINHRLVEFEPILLNCFLTQDSI